MSSEKSTDQTNLERNIEKSKRENTEQVLPKGTKPEIKDKKKIKDSKETKSITEKIKDLVTIKINEGFELKDKNSKLELNKLIQSELHLAKGWSSDINKQIRDVALEKKLIIADLGFKDDKIGDITVNLVSDSGVTTPTTDSISVQSKVPTNQKGALPRPEKELPTLPKTSEQERETTTEEVSEEKKYMSDTAQKKLISDGLTKLILPLYVSLGIFEPDESEKKEEEKLTSIQQARKSFEELATDIDKYLVENNMKLPAFLNHLAIVISIFVVLVLPVIKFKMFSSGKETKPDYDKDADNVKVD